MHIITIIIILLLPLEDEILPRSQLGHTLGEVVDTSQYKDLEEITDMSKIRFYSYVIEDGTKVDLGVNAQNILYRIRWSTKMEPSEFHLLELRMNNIYGRYKRTTDMKTDYVKQIKYNDNNTEMVIIYISSIKSITYNLIDRRTEEGLPRSKYGYTLGEIFDQTKRNYSIGKNSDGQTIYYYKDNETTVNITPNKAGVIIAIVWHLDIDDIKITQALKEELERKYSKYITSKTIMSNNQYALVLMDDRTKFNIIFIGGQLILSLADIAEGLTNEEKEAKDILP